MKRKETSFKNALLFITKKKVIQYLLIVVVILLPVGKIINDKFFNNDELNKEVESSEIEKPAVAGTINTDVEKNIEEDNNISRYNIDDGFSEIGEEIKYNNSSTNNSTIVNIDKSSLNGRDITIFEGDSFEAIKDLNLSAIDKDGSDISSKINIESNSVNTEKPGVYSVKAAVTLKDGRKLQKILTVNVKATDLEVNVDSFNAAKEQFNRNEKVTLNLNIKSSKKYVKASAVIINGTEYSVYKDKTSLFSNTQKYKINVEASDVSGKKDYNLSCIRMSDNTLINIDNTVTVEILKAEAKIKNFTYEEQALSKRILAKFDLQDVDNSISNFKMEVYKDKELIHTEKLDKKDKYEIYIRTYSNGVYNIKFIADININSEITEGNTILNKEIFTETIKITNINETSLTGKNIEIMKGQKFDPKVDLELKAIDVHGEDITDKIVIDINNVDVNKPGKYQVKAYVINKDNKKFYAIFTVTVKEQGKESDEDIDTNLGVTTLSNFNGNDSRSGRALVRDIVSGNDTETLDVDVKVTGTVTKADGIAPAGKIQVEVPTSLAFSVDQAGNFKAPTFTIKNESSVDVLVYVGSFKETKVNDGITIQPLSKDLTSLDRSNVHLYLSGDQQIDLGEVITTEKHLTEVQAANTKNIQLLGEAGKASGTTVDINGASEKFNLVFKIKKKN